MLQGEEIGFWVLPQLSFLKFNMDGVAREKPLKKKDCVAREKEGVLRMVKGKFYLYFLNMWGIKER